MCILTSFSIIDRTDKSRLDETSRSEWRVEREENTNRRFFIIKSRRQINDCAFHIYKDSLFSICMSIRGRSRAEYVSQLAQRRAKAWHKWKIVNNVYSRIRPGDVALQRDLSWISSLCHKKYHVAPCPRPSFRRDFTHRDALTSSRIISRRTLRSFWIIDNLANSKTGMPSKCIFIENITVTVT